MIRASSIILADLPRQRSTRSFIRSPSRSADGHDDSLDDFCERHTGDDGRDDALEVGCFEEIGEIHNVVESTTSQLIPSFALFRI